MFWSLTFNSKDYKINRHVNKKGQVKYAVISRKTNRVIHRVDETRFKIINGNYHITR